jgi:hypothetical protein
MPAHKIRRVGPGGRGSGRGSISFSEYIFFLLIGRPSALKGLQFTRRKIFAQARQQRK